MIIVTGGAGFIGSCIVAALQKAGKKDLVVVDYLGTDEKWKNIAKRELAACVHPDDFDAFLKKMLADGMMSVENYAKIVRNNAIDLLKLDLEKA